MKKLKFVAALLALATAVGFSGCSSCEDDTPPNINPPPSVDDPDDPPEPIDPQPDDFVSVAVTREELTIKDYEAEDYNFARYFRISDNDSGVSAKDYVDASAVKAEAGTYTVTCTYKEKTASIKVTVEASEASITLSKSEIEINTAAVADYNFKGLFTLKVDGKVFAITDGMITSDIRAEAGEYSYTVTFFGVSETLKVKVIDEHAIEIVNSYGVLEITREELETFDYTSLFSVYVGGVAERVLAEYIDASALSAPEEGQTYSVTIKFEKNGREASSAVQIKVVSKTQISIASNNIVTYPNSEDIDLKSLFTIKNGNRTIEVTDDMISGGVDYSKEGDNIITLSYGGKKATATVTIKLGVIIDYASSDTVFIEKGTPIDSYDFGADFNVIINGIRFTDFPASYFDTTGTDFNTVGEYKVKISVPYNTKPVGVSNVNFDYFEKEITYSVVENKTEYSISILRGEVVLPAGTASYNVYDNLNVVINGIRRKLYEDKDKIDITTCYARTVSEPLDFTTPAEQTVEIDVYVYGPEFDPVRVAYTLRIDNGVEIKGQERVIFSGTTVYARELFTITENGENVPVTDSMLSGKIDLFNSGIYYVTATYKGVTAEAKAVVLDSSMMGTYKTLLTEIEVYEEDNDDDYEDLGWGDYALSPDNSSSYASRLNDLVIDADGDIYWGGRKAEIVSIIDGSTFSILLYSNEYLLRYEDGVITLDPDTSIRMSYHDFRRPMVYFHEDVWTTAGSIEINSSSDGYNVLQKNPQGNPLVSSGYTIDLTRLKSVADGEYYWYGMKTTFIGKYDSNTYYADEVFGFASVAPGFEPKAGTVSNVSLGGANYDFTMTNGYKATINKVVQSVSEFAGMSFKGTVDGKAAVFSVGVNDSITYTIEGRRVFDLSPNEQNSLKNSGVDYGENTWLVYDMLLDNEHTPYSYRFRLDKENRTFTIDERDDVYGRYVYGNVCFFFDGYGTGEANFDTASKYNTTAFSYSRNGSNIEITYLNPQPQFAYGATAKFLLADYKNILTVREISGIDLVGRQFVNAVISDGAIVKVNSFEFGKGSAKSDLLAAVSIITADGELTAAQMDANIAGTKTKYVDASLIKFSRAGFYQLKINIPVGGEIKPSYYAIQILDNIYSGNSLVGRYYQSAVNGGASLNLDEFGRVTGVYAGMAFKGNARLADGKFTATAECETGKFTISGEIVEDGIIKATARGALMFTDCFTSGTVKTCGTEGLTLRVITAGGKTVCMLSNAATALGNAVEVEGNLNTVGSVLKITDGSKEYVVKVTEWGGADKGLVLSDAVRGVYKLEGADDLVLDGFGQATVGENHGSYIPYGNGVTVLFGNAMRVYRVDTKNSTYTVGGVPDAALFAGKSFTAEYTFFCEYSEQIPYRAITVLEFKADGKVTVKSTSAEHDEDCDDRYSPEFATASGIEGTFSVAGNKITVKVNGKTIVFTFTDAVGLNAITCSSTDVSSASHGYFGADKEFARV